MQKNTIRKSALERRKLLPTDLRRNANTKIAEQVLSYPLITTSLTICLYISLPDEVDTKNLVQRLLQLNKRIVVPKIVSASIIKLYSLQSFSDLRKSVYSIYEPTTKTNSVLPSAVDLFLVPGVAFDRKGNRVGRGKGYYDRLLASVHKPLIGLAYDAQIVPYIPHESYDILMTAIITENEIIAI